MATTTDSLKLQLSLHGLASVEAGIKQVANTVGSIKNAVLPLAGVFAGLAGLNGLQGLAKGVLNLGSELQTMKSIIGASIPELMAMRKLLSDSGASADELGTLLAQMQSHIIDAAEKGGSLAKSLSEIGLSADQLLSQSPGQQFRAIAEGIAQLNNEAQKTAVARDIFGRTGAVIKGAFADLDKVRAAFDSSSPFSVAMARSAEMFHQTELALNKFAGNGKRMMAGFLDEVLPQLEGLFTTLGKIDFTEIGQRVGALFAVIIESVKANKFPEMVGLLIEAGFEIGIKQVNIAWNDFLQNQFGLALVNAVLTYGNKAAQAFVSLANASQQFFMGLFESLMTGLSHLYEGVLGFILAGVLKLGSVLENTFAAAINFLAGGLEKSINLAIDGFNKIAGMLGLSSTGHVALGRMGTSDLSFADARKQAAAIASVYADAFREVFHDRMATVKGFFAGINSNIGRWLQEQLELSRIGLGIGTGGGKGTALAKLSAMMDEYQRKRAAMAGPNDPVSGGTPGSVIRARELNALANAELSIKERLLDLESARAKVDADYSLTDAEKFHMRRELLEQERQQLEAIVQLDQQRLSLLDQNSPEFRAAQNNMLSDQRRLNGVGTAIQGLGPDPNSWGQQFAAAMTGIQNQWGSWAKQAAMSFAGVFNSAIDSISSGITSLIQGTKNWGEALMEIGSSIVNSVIQAIVQMGVRWVATQLMMAVAGKAILASATAATAPLAMAQSAIWATPATLATIASFGGAAAAAPGFIEAAKALTLATSLTGFMQGGFTGFGNPSMPAGLVHRGEYVFDAPATQRIGLGNLEALRGGFTPPSQSTSSTAAASAASLGVNVALINSRAEMREFFRSDPGMQKVVVDLVRRNRLDIGVRT